MSEQTEQIYSILLSRAGYAENLFQDVREARRQGREMVGECPFCHKPGKFSYSLVKPLWRCWSSSCGHQGDWIDWLEQFHGQPFQEALAWLARDAGIELDGFDRAAYQEKQRRISLLEAVQAYCERELWRPAGAEVLAYLRGRGYSDEDIGRMQLGAYNSREALQAHLAGLGYGQQELEESGLLKWPWGEWHRLTMLWQDAAGRAVGLVGRALLPESQLPEGVQKYRYSTGMPKAEGLIGIDAARGSSRVLLLEGVLDAKYLSAQGLPAVAIGGTSFSKQQERVLLWAGVEELLLALDADEPGRAATREIVRQLYNSRDLRTYVVSWSGGYKDPDELVRAEGLEALQEATRAAVDWPEWLAWDICQQEDLETTRGLDAALDRALRAYTSIQDALHKKRLLKALREATGLAPEDLQYRLDVARQRAAQEAQKRATEATILEARQQLAGGDLRGAEEALAGGLLQIRASRGVEEPEPYLATDWQEELATLTAGRRIGWECLEPVVRIPGGALMYIAGRPGQGKTTTMLNMLCQQLDLYPTDRFYFFTYEESRARLMIKLAMIRAGVTLQAESNFEAYLGKLRDRRELARLPAKQQEPIREALATLDEWTSSGRLVMVDRPYPVEDLAAVIGLVGSRREAGAVFIDYVQKIPVREVASAGYLDIKHRSQLLLEQAVLHELAIVAGAQLNRAPESRSNKDLLPSDLREGGDLEQDANTILGIRSQETEEAEGGQAGTSETVSMTFQVMKNRGAGGVGRKFSLDWHRPTYRLVDKTAGRGLPW